MDTDKPSVIRRSDMGLTLSGTRLTLYALMDYLHAGWPQEEIRDALDLTAEQLRVALDYITAHRDEVEAEYRDVVRAAQERRHYWEKRLQEHLAKTPRTSPTPEKAALYAKLAEQRGQTLRELLRAGESDATQAARS